MITKSVFHKNITTFVSPKQTWTDLSTMKSRKNEKKKSWTGNKAGVGKWNDWRIVVVYQQKNGCGKVQRANSAKRWPSLRVNQQNREACWENRKNTPGYDRLFFASATLALVDVVTSISHKNCTTHHQDPERFDGDRTNTTKRCHDVRQTFTLPS